MDTETIYMPMLHEGTDVWRPVQAEWIAGGWYVVLGPVPESEQWQFAPGTIVQARSKKFSEGDVLVACSSLTKQQVRGIKSLSVAGDRLTPIQLTRVTQDVVDQLIALGLVECGDCNRRYEELWGYTNGYRLTRDGRAALSARRSK